MTRKYVPPKKKKSHAARAHFASSAVPVADSPGYSASEFSVAYPVVAKNEDSQLVGSGVATHNSLPAELRRIALVTALTLAVMLVLWAIFR